MDEGYFKGQIGVCQFCGQSLVLVMSEGHPSWCQNHIPVEEVDLFDEEVIEKIRESLRKLAK